MSERGRSTQVTRVLRRNRLSTERGEALGLTLKNEDQSMTKIIGDI